jgi:subtilisin
LQRVKLGSSPRLRLRCPSIASHPRDAIASLYSAVNPLDGHGVRVAIVDGGVGPHKELRLGAPGKTFGSSKSVGDNGVGHGTHVAGIIRRLAPAADLRSYRVFDDGSMATHGAIVAAAVQQAIRDGVQVINLSITFPQHSPVLESALNLARVKGVICVCAAGNDAGPVMVPAKYTAAVAVAACGQADWPTGALDRELLARAGTKTTGLHAAAFTCFGREITFTAPGVGLVSAYPKNRRAVMSGTSMSAPVVTGLLAKALSQGTPAMPALVAAAKRLGVDSKYQGHGVPFP